MLSTTHSLITGVLGSFLSDPRWRVTLKSGEVRFDRAKRFISQNEDGESDRAGDYVEASLTPRQPTARGELITTATVKLSFVILGSMLGSDHFHCSGPKEGLFWRIDGPKGQRDGRIGDVTNWTDACVASLRGELLLYLADEHEEGEPRRVAEAMGALKDKEALACSPG